MRVRAQSVKMFRSSTLPELRLSIASAKEEWNVEVGAIQAVFPTVPHIYLAVIPGERALDFKPILRPVLQGLDQVLAAFRTDKNKRIGGVLRQDASRWKWKGDPGAPTWRNGR